MTASREAEEGPPPGGRDRSRLLLGGIVGVYLVLGVGFNLATPLYEGFDEAEHVEYVSFVRSTWGIPDLPGEIFEAVQPPAYYFLQAAVTSVLGAPDPPELESNPVGGSGDEPFFLHPEEELDHPLSGGTGSVRLMRLVSTLLGAATLLVVYATASRALPGRPEMALAITGTTAFVPQFVSIHALVNNDALAILMGAAALYASVRLLAAADRRDRLRMAALAGAAVGLGVLAKGYALAAIPVPVVALVLSRASRRDVLAGVGLFLAVFLAVAGWLFVRNLDLYGEPWPDRAAQEHLAQELPQSIVDRSVFDPVFRDVFFREIRDSFWYSGGFGQIRAPAGVYFGLDLASGALAVGAVGALFGPARIGLGQSERRALALFAVALGLQVAGIVYYNLSIQQFQGRWLFSVQPAIAALMVVGAAALVGARARRAVISWLPMGLLALTVFVLFGVAMPAFSRAG